MGLDGGGLSPGGALQSSDGGESTGLSLGGSYTVLETDNDVLLTVECLVETDGTNGGQVDINVDESGGSTADYTMSLYAPEELGANVFLFPGVYGEFIPAGASVQIENVSDPVGDNALRVNRMHVL